MPFHHVLIELIEEPNTKREIFADLSEEEVKERFVLPLKNREEIHSDGKVIRPDRISGIWIIRTERPNQVERKAIHENSLRRIAEFNREGSGVILPAAFGYFPNDIVEAGQNVTSSFISRGRRSNFIDWQAITNHPWTIAIVGGLIVTIAGGVAVAAMTGG